MVDNKRLNCYSLYCAIFFNSALLAGALYFLSDYDVTARSTVGDNDNDNTIASVIFFEDGMGLIRNATMILQFNHTFTDHKQDDIEPSSTGLKFRNNGTVILK